MTVVGRFYEFLTVRNLTFIRPVTFLTWEFVHFLVLNSLNCDVFSALGVGPTIHDLFNKIRYSIGGVT